MKLINEREVLFLENIAQNIPQIFGQNERNNRFFYYKIEKLLHVQI